MMPDLYIQPSQPLDNSYTDRYIIYRKVYNMITNDNSKEVILNTAILLFSQKGYEGVGVQEICEHAGITKPTLYYFFKSKQGLLQAIADSKGAELLQKVSDAAVYEHDFIKGLTKILTAVIDFALENPAFFNLHSVLLHAPGNAETEAAYAPLKRRFEALFEEFFIKSAHEFGNMRGKEALYAVLYHNNVVSVALLCVHQKLRRDDQTVYRIVHSFVYGVA